jgi:outer membrane protein insertion porin family
VLALWIASLLLPNGARAQELDPDRYREFEDKPITQVTIAGNNVTKDYVIDREIRSDVGKEFRYDRMRDDIIRLINLGIFSSVEVIPTADGDGVALEYHVRELPWIIPYLKFKYNETDGWSIGPTVSSVNLFGRDIYLTGFILFGATNTYSVQFSWPWIAGDHISLDLVWQALERRNTFYDFEETSNEFTPWIGTYLGENGRLAGTVSYFGVESDVPGRTLNPSNRDDMYRIGAMTGYDSRDNWQNPTTGWQHELQFLSTGNFLGGDGDFTTAVVDLRRYQPTLERQTLSLGTLMAFQTGTVGTDIPIYMQYNLGGANSIRGHTVTGLGEQLFGKNEFIATVEYDFLLMPITEYEVLRWAVTLGIEATVFADTGIAWSATDEFTSERFKSGFGVGLRALVPAIDVVRLDVGFNLQGGVEFHFGLWPKFEAQRLRIR